MDTCFENLVHHLHLGIRRLEQLKKSVKVCGVDCDLVRDLLHTRPNILCTKSWAQICPRTWLSRVTLGIGSDPGLDPGFTTLGRHTYHTHA